MSSIPAALNTISGFRGMNVHLFAPLAIASLDTAMMRLSIARSIFSTPNARGIRSIRTYTYSPGQGKRTDQ
jgi:hypothetical protein